jgi:hypothetical protein
MDGNPTLDELDFPDQPIPSRPKYARELCFCTAHQGNNDFCNRYLEHPYKTPVTANTTAGVMLSTAAASPSHSVQQATAIPSSLPSNPPRPRPLYKGKTRAATPTNPSRHNSLSPEDQNAGTLPTIQEMDNSPQTPPGDNTSDGQRSKRCRAESAASNADEGQSAEKRARRAVSIQLEDAGMSKSGTTQANNSNRVSTSGPSNPQAPIPPVSFVVPGARPDFTYPLSNKSRPPLENLAFPILMANLPK